MASNKLTLKKIGNQFLNLGIHHHLEPSLIIRIRLLNVLNLACLIISLFYAWINSSINEIATVINLASVLVNISIYVFTLNRKYYTAFYILLFLNAIIGLSFVIFFGKYLAADLLFCVGIVYSIAMFNKWSRIGFGVILNVLLYIVSMYIYENYIPYFKDEIIQSTVFYYPNTALFLITLFGLVYLLKRENQDYEKNLRKINNELHTSNRKNEELIYNILPHEIAEELREKGEVEPRIYKNVTVMFTDFFEFTKTAEKLTAIQLVRDLDEYFTVFDRIIEKYELEKLKTIGDAYMCVSGIPQEREDHAIRMIKAAIDIRDAVELMFEERSAKGKDAWHIRIGIHSGSAVAGIIGESKFSFDIWGDNVNTAARMESSSEPGKINISETTYQIIQKQVECTFRGKVEAKNKGEMNMYFVEGLK